MDTWAMGSYNKIILFVMMIPLFTAGIMIVGLQQASAGGAPQECGTPSPTVSPDMIDETLRPEESHEDTKVFVPNEGECDFIGFEEPPFRKGGNCSGSGFEDNILIDVEEVDLIEWDETITVKDDAEPGRYHCDLFWRLTYSIAKGEEFIVEVKQEIWITVEGFEKTLVDDISKSDMACTDGMPIGALTTTMCTFSIEYIGDPLLIVDTVPAEWEFVSQTGACTIEKAGKGNPSKSATKIDCGVTDNLFEEFKFQTRQSPGKNNVKFAPTSCDKELKLNESALALDPTTLEIIETSNMIVTPTVDDPNDTDCDQVENDKDMCDFSDPINLGPIDDWGCDRTQSDA